MEVSLLSFAGCACVFREGSTARTIRKLAKNWTGKTLTSFFIVQARCAALYLHHFFFLRLAHLFHLLDFVVGKLLGLGAGALLFVFGDLLVLQSLLDGIVSVAADVADGSPIIFQHLVQVLHHLPAALFGE